MNETTKKETASKVNKRYAVQMIASVSNEEVEDLAKIVANKLRTQSKANIKNVGYFQLVKNNRTKRFDVATRTWVQPKTHRVKFVFSPRFLQAILKELGL